ncbi:MAG: hypothetical protein ACXWI3_07385 [Croceibacterium sp.]
MPAEAFTTAISSPSVALRTKKKSSGAVTGLFLVLIALNIAAWA